MADVSSGNHASEAQMKVLDLPELVEGILSFLPTLDLPAASKVNRRWQDVVKRDRFQQALFIKPVSKTLVYWRANEGNPKEGVWSSSETEIVPVKVFLNPLIQSMPKLFDPTHHKEMKYGAGRRPTRSEFEANHWDRKVPRRLQPLLMTQPPMAWLRFAYTEAQPDGKTVLGAKIAPYNEEHMSITLKELNEELPKRNPPNIEFVGATQMRILTCATDLDGLRPSHNLTESR